MTMMEAHNVIISAVIINIESSKEAAYLCPANHTSPPPPITPTKGCKAVPVIVVIEDLESRLETADSTTAIRSCHHQVR